MTASRLYPKIYKGKEESGGYVAVNESRKSDTSPHYRGRVYIAGVGWYWLSGWIKERQKGELIALSAKEMTDTDAKQYCAEKTTKTRTNTQPSDETTNSEPAQEVPDDIPF